MSSLPYLRPRPQGIPGRRKWSCTLCRWERLGLPRPAGSGRAYLRHPEVTAYRCFLPDLTGFTGLRRAGPDLPRRLSPAVPSQSHLEREFDPACSGFRVQGTASSPSSTTKDIIPEPSVSVKEEREERRRRRGRDLNPRGLRPHDFQSCALGRTMRPLRATRTEYTIEDRVEQIRRVFSSAVTLIGECVTGSESTCPASSTPGCDLDEP